MFHEMGSLNGSGVLCTPRGETSKLDVDAWFEGHVGVNTDGKKFKMLLRKEQGIFPTNDRDDRSVLDSYGAWHNPPTVRFTVATRRSSLGPTTRSR